MLNEIKMKYIKVSYKTLKIWIKIDLIYQILILMKIFFEKFVQKDSKNYNIIKVLIKN